MNIVTILAAAIPAPDPLPMPAPSWLLWTLLILTFTLHAVVMNLVLGGSIVLAVARIRGGENAERLAVAAGKLMPTLVATAVTLGVAALLFVQILYGRLFFTSAVLMAWLWFAVVPLLIVAYYGTYLISFRKERIGKTATVLAVIVALILTGIAFIYTNNMSLMLRADRFLPMYVESGRGLHLNSGDPTTWPRYLHMLFGAIAVAGLAIALYGAAKEKSDEEHGRWAMRYGALWFAIPTLLNVLAGLLWLGMMPREVILRFMGGNGLATLFLGAGVALGFASLAMMFLAIGSREPRSLVVWSGWTTLGTLVTMILARDQVRREMLAVAGFRPSPIVAPQWDVIAIFFVLFVAALATVGWMVSLLFRPRAEGEHAV